MKRSNQYWLDRAKKLEADKEKRSEQLSRRVKVAYAQSYKRICDRLDQLEAEILDKGGTVTTRSELYRLNKWTALRESLAKELGSLATHQTEQLTEHLTKIALDTFGVNMKTFGTQFNHIYEMQAKQIVMTDWSGQLFSARLWQNANAINARVVEDLEKLVIEGANPSKVKKELMRDFNIGYHEADRLIRTESSHVYNTAAIESYKAAGCDSVDFLAEDDCCDICEESSGVRYPIDDAPSIPVHPNCRCTYIPVVDI